ncbi:hypothetical protein ACHAQA_008829, partial [Verticillium albo-atrum]
FVVGPNGRRLRVHSLFVTTASKVFKAMLCHNFKEGQQLAEQGSIEVALPEDNADAIEIVFNIIHGRNNMVREILAPGELLQVAIICDKYDCTVSLTFAIQAWLSRHSSGDSADQWTLAMAALVLRTEERFEAATKSLIFDHAGSYGELARRHEESLDPVMQLRTAGMH